MRNIFVFIFSILIGFTGYSQCENPYYPIKEGTHYTYKTYNAKDKYQSKMDQEVTNVKQISGGVEWTFKITFYDKKDKEISENEISFTCKDGVVKKDLSDMIPKEVLSSFEGMETSMECDEMIFPSEFSVGQSFPDGKCIMNTSMGSGMNMKMTFVTDNRKVLAKENITTEAGTYNAYKITQHNHYSMEMPMMSANNKDMGKSLTWLSKDVGMVKSEEYNKNGNLDTYSVLTEFKKP